MPRKRIASNIRFRIRYALLALLAAVVFGTVGFHFIEGWSPADSFYVTVQTLTTVGYGDQTPHSGAGRMFAVVVMLIGAGGVALAISTIVQSVVQSELVATFGQRRRSKRMSKLSNHYIICGAGRVGSHLVRDLIPTNESFVVIESDQQRAAEFKQRGIDVLVSDATLEETLREARVEHARGLAACLPKDADNVYVVLTARDLNPDLRISMRRQAGDMLFNPASDAIIENGDILIAIGRAESLIKLNELARGLG